MFFFFFFFSFYCTFTTRSIEQLFQPRLLPSLLLLLVFGDNKRLSNFSMTSSGLLSLVLSFLLSFLVLVFFLKKKTTVRLPPGPPALPLLGNILQLDRKAPFKTFIQLSKTYGPVFTVYIGTQPVLVLCGYKAVKEALVDHGEEFSGRGAIPILKRITNGYGLAFSNGERWKQLRRFSLMTLRNFGMGKRDIEERIQEEAQYLVEEFSKTKELPFSPVFRISCAVSNIICSIIFGDRFDYEDKNFLKLMHMINEIFRLMSSGWGQLYNAFPNLMYYLPGPHNKIFENAEKLKSFISERVKMHQDTFAADSCRDYIDSFLLKIHEEKDNPSSEFHLENLMISTSNLFTAGSETTSTTLRYGFLILLRYPHIQEKIHQEIDQVIGRNRSPAMENRMKMPYTEAVLHEIQRFLDIVPMNVPHSVIQDTQFRGYTIPKGTTVFPLLSSVLYDPDYFDSAETFNPGHFLDENGHFKKNEAFIPFSTGKRICLGEGLARMELFLFFTTLLQNFTFKSLVDPEEIDITPGLSGFGNLPRPYEFCALKR
nr:PREDICTED: cytochrome P450 2G1-like isoform X1 [Latimeria chalumnae]|eukprot:XP_014350151.1 PREDICTED: cytochrome P450 2G1-like isoform X1 [Latimeria chalumnae]